jgi:hypothetical protein
MEFLPGYVQGIVRVIVSYPFDYIRTNIQSKNASSIQSFFKERTLKSMYRGVSLPLFIVPIDRSLSFFVFETLKKKEMTNLTSSIISTSISSIYNIPINFLSTKIITSSSTIKDVFDSFRKGKTFYKGSLPEISRAFISSTIFLTVYGRLRDLPNEYHNYVIFGMLSSLSSWVFTYPFDTMKVLKQTRNESYLKIIKHDTKHLYKGFSLILLRALPSAGLGMYAYEYTKNLTASLT